MFYSNLTRTGGTLHEDLCAFMIISHWILLRPRNFSGKILEKIKNKFYVQYFFFENRAVYEIMWKNMVGPDRWQMTNNMTQKICDSHAGWLRHEYRHTLRIFSTYCFSTATMVTGTRLSVTLYAHCLSCFHAWDTEMRKGREERDFAYLPTTLDSVGNAFRQWSSINRLISKFVCLREFVPVLNSL
jgi:hypothetical protein